MAMYRTDSEVEFKRMMRTKWVLMILNAIVFLAALATFGICLWIRFDLDFKIWIPRINWYSYWYCTYVIMLAMVLVVLTSILQMYSIIVESKGLLGFSACLLSVAWVMELVGAIVVCIYGVEESDVLTRELREVFLALIYKFDYDPQAARILKQIQEYVGCCGAKGSEDYTAARKPVPLECRNIVTGNEYRYGCQQQFAWWLEPWTASLAGVCAILLIVHIIQMIFVSKLYKRMRSYEQTANNDY